MNPNRDPYKILGPTFLTLCCKTIHSSDTSIENPSHNKAKLFLLESTESPKTLGHHWENSNTCSPRPLKTSSDDQQKSEMIWNEEEKPASAILSCGHLNKDTTRTSRVEYIRDRPPILNGTAIAKHLTNPCSSCAWPHCRSSRVTRSSSCLERL